MSTRPPRARRGRARPLRRRGAAIFEALPRQVIHNDFNPHNVLVDGDTGERVTGVIDFGDMVVGPRVQDLAVALAYQIERGGGLDLADALLAGYAEHIAIGDDEAAILPAMVAARMAMTIVIGEWRAGLYRPPPRLHPAQSFPRPCAGSLCSPPTRRPGLRTSRAGARPRFRRRLIQCR